MKKHTHHSPIVRTVAFVLLLAAVLSLVSCRDERYIVHSGIDIKDDETAVYSAETRSRAENTALSVLNRVYADYVGGTPGEADSEELSLIAERSAEISMDGRISQREYLAVLDVLDMKAADAISEVISFIRGNSSALGCTEDLYLSLSKCASTDYVGRLFYNLALYSYEYRYEKQMERYERYGYAYLLEEAEALELDKTVLTEGIGEENFSLVLSIGFAAGDLFFGGALEAEQLDAFSDAELLVFIEHLDISSIDITADGWELILSFLVPEDKPSELTYTRALLYRAEELGDLARIASVMENVIHLLAYMQTSLDSERISVIRCAETERVLGDILSDFTDTEWEALECLLSFAEDGSAYDEVALLYYPDEYSRYLLECETLTLDELKSITDGDKIYESVEGYIAGKATAFSFLFEL